MPIALALALLVLPAQPAGGASFDHVVVISVDGLRSDALMAPPAGEIPSLRRLLAGASTLNARTDADFTITLPNHVCMVTGRGVQGPGGHRWAMNRIGRDHNVLHEDHGAYVASVFDVAHDHGVHTGVFVSKLKLALIDLSWNETNGAEDGTGDDDGRDKVDAFLCASDQESATTLTDAVLEALGAGHERTLLFVHYRDPDVVGHGSGWDLTVGSPYLRAVALVDGEVGRILDAVRASERLRGRTAVILTADHGGGAPHKSHKRPEMWVNYIIPFLVWQGDDGPAADLYELNRETRADPGLRRPFNGEDPPPIRNGDAANLALDLLGLPHVPGSVINAGQDLSVGTVKTAR